MSGGKILIIDDDAGLCEVITLLLRSEDYEVDSEPTGRDGLNAVATSQPDLVILDVNLPDMTGFEVLQELHRNSKTCVLMLTGRTETNDIVQGLDGGADDYLTKPFKTEELMARVRALLRRIPPSDRPLSAAGNAINIDTKTRTVRVRGEVVELTPTEYQLLLLMAQSPGEVFDHHTLLRNVWGEEFINDTAYLKVYIWHLRRKLEENPHEPKLVMTEWGVGYRLAP